MKFSLFRKKTSYVLMHGNIPAISFHHDGNAITEITEIFHSEALPTGTTKGGRPSVRALNGWLEDRAIPSDRSGIQELMHLLSIDDIHSLYLSDHARSLSDTFWIRESNENITWDQISPYTQDFDFRGFADAVFMNVPASRAALATPNNMTSGKSPKAWIIEEGRRYLCKSATDHWQIAPVNEWLAYEIGKKLGMNVLEYQLQTIGDRLVSVSPCMCDSHTDFIGAQQILSSFSTQKAFEFQYRNYVVLLKEHGITEAEKKLSALFVLDFLMMNTDRSMKTTGVLSDSDGRWIDIAPIFNNGEALGAGLSDREIKTCQKHATYRLFDTLEVPFESLYPLIRFDEYDFNSLLSLPREYGNRLVEFQKYTGISDDRINDQYVLFYSRILELKKAAEYAKKKR